MPKIDVRTLKGKNYSFTVVVITDPKGDYVNAIQCHQTVDLEDMPEVLQVLSKKLKTKIKTKPKKWLCPGCCTASNWSIVWRNADPRPVFGNGYKPGELRGPVRTGWAVNNRVWENELAKKVYQWTNIDVCPNCQTDLTKITAEQGVHLADPE